MDKDKKPEDDQEKGTSPASAQDTKDASPLDGNAPEESKDASESTDSEATKKEGEEKPAATQRGLKQTLKRFWLYLVIVLLVAVIGGVYAVVSSLQNKKTPPPPSVQSQAMTEEQLKQLAKTPNSSSGQTLTIQGDSILDGQDAIRGNLNVAGDIQAGGTLSIPALTISNTGNFGNAQVSSLQVATTSSLGSATLQNGLNLAGNTSISDVTVGTLTATRFIMTSNGVITVPHHLMFTGNFPHRTISFGVLGNGGEASVNGSDTNGTVSLNTGSGPRPGCFITVIFLIPFAGPANILLGPIGLGSAGSQDGSGLHPYVQPVTDPTTGNTTAFKICTTSTPLPNQAFGFSYLVNGSPN